MVIQATAKPQQQQQQQQQHVHAWKSVMLVLKKQQPFIP
jgi:hypothetical protein